MACIPTQEWLDLPGLDATLPEPMQLPLGSAFHRFCLKTREAEGASVSQLMRLGDFVRGGKMLRPLLFELVMGANSLLKCLLLQSLSVRERPQPWSCGLCSRCSQAM